MQLDDQPPDEMQLGRGSLLGPDHEMQLDGQYPDEMQLDRDSDLGREMQLAQPRDREMQLASPLISEHAIVEIVIASVSVHVSVRHASRFSIGSVCARCSATAKCGTSGSSSASA